LDSSLKAPGGGGGGSDDFTFHVDFGQFLQGPAVALARHMKPGVDSNRGLLGEEGVLRSLPPGLYPLHPSCGLQ